MSDRPQLLLTPGPLSTSDRTRGAMMRDWGSRDPAFIVLTRHVSDRIATLAGGGDTHRCVLLQGSGTFGLEAAAATFIPPSGHVLVLANGAYCQRMAKIAETVGRHVSIYETPEDMPPDPAEVGRLLGDDDTISHVAMVHCETTSGILNPLAEIAEVVRSAERSLIVDAISSFGGIPLDVNETPVDVLIASSNKCLEGAPGLVFAVVRNEVLAASEGNAASVVLDLHAQAAGFEKSGEWRFTPPTHVVAALDAALEQLDEEGGIAGRHARYRENCDVLVDGMTALGFRLYLSHNLQSPIIVTFDTPDDPNFDFDRFYTGLQDHGFTIYPGKLTKAESFRIGCIGQVFKTDMQAAVRAVDTVMKEIGVSL